MNAKKILFSTDFSTQNDASLAQATALARDANATLIIVHVAEPPVAYMGEFYYGFPEPDRSALKKMLESIVPTDPAVPCKHVLLTGDPAAEIVQLAKNEGADLIVLGTHGRTGLARMLMGSVAEQVVRRAPCPVLTVKQPRQTAATV